MLRSVVCDRMRSYVSLELDAELSVLERRMLDTHLDRCAECRSYSAEVRGFTRELRAAEAALPEHRVAVSPRRPARVPLRAAQAAAAAAVVLVAGGLGTVLAPERQPRAAVRLDASSKALKLIDGYLQPALAPSPKSGPTNAQTIAL